VHSTVSPPIVDAHSDLLQELVHAHDALQEQRPFRARWLAPLQRGGVALQVCAIYVDANQSPADGLRAMLRQASAFNDVVSTERDTVFAVRARADLDRIGGAGDRVGLMLAIEGAAALAGDVSLLEVFAELGVRMASLTWNERNLFAGGCHHADGLSPLGERLVDRMRTLGIVPDLAHASARTMADVLALDDGPLLVSHAACRALHDHPRNLSDSQLEALAVAGGVIGLMPHPFVLGDATLDAFVDHVDHAVSVIGTEHIGLGGDFLRQIMRALGAGDQLEDGMRLDAALDELAGPEDYPVLVDALACRGYDDAARRAILGGNLVTLLRRTLPC
jgi:membrane dipeptidase